MSRVVKYHNEVFFTTYTQTHTHTGCILVCSWKEVLVEICWNCAYMIIPSGCHNKSGVVAGVPVQGENGEGGGQMVIL